MVLTVLDTEDIKPKHVLGKRANDGMFKRLKLILTGHLRNLMLVWNRINAETQMVGRQQFGVTQQM